ncbi:ABC transporter substrate-binding protein [Dongshaea marina]|uniref:ABC transporter substrate-binding protein n=1 Tax=Dongshaea marina TaxID=2047966 RepID=UPI00131F2B2A|nr:ABC transporter substrate-binding protein [Dongshaea marina]
MGWLRLLGIILPLIFIMPHAWGEEPVKVAVILSKSGKVAYSNLKHLNAIRMAVEEINQNGGVLGKKIELLEIDNKSSASHSKIAAQKAVAENSIAVIGAAWSSHSLAMAPVLQQAGLPMISYYSTNPKVTQVGDYIFRACFMDLFQGEVLAKFAQQDLGAKKIIILTNVSDQYSIGLSRIFKENLNTHAVFEGSYLQGDTDFSALLEKVKGYEADLIFLPGHTKDSGRIIKQARNMGINAPFLGGDGWGLKMYKYGGQAIEGNYYSTHWHKDINTPQNQRFVKNFTILYGTPESNGSALAYDSVYLLADAIKRAGSLDRKQIRDALAETRDFKGATGTIRFNNNGDPQKSAVLLKFQDGGSVYFRTIDPS